MSVPADDALHRAREDAVESARRRQADRLVLADADFISNALRDLRTNDRFADRVRDTFREHG